LPHHRISRTRAAAALLVLAALALALAGCGSSSPGDAKTLLKQTFSGSHKVDSGDLNFTLSLTPTGSTTLTQPVVLSFGGPFQSLGTGKLPQSDFTVSISAQGHTGALSIVSTGTKGFVTLSGASYQLPAASFQKLESSFSSIASSGSGGSHSSALSRLGISPLNWLGDPTVVGSGSVGGTPTTHIRAKIDLPALLRDLSTFLQKAQSLGVSGAGKIPTSISPATQAHIAGEVQHPSFDVWTGTNDKTVRKLSIGLTLPVTGQITTLLGGMRAAGINLTLQYTKLNQPQTITAPTNLQPYSVFSTRLKALLQTVEGSLASSALGSSSSSGSSGATGSGSTGSGTTTSSGAAGATNAYSQCITSAKGDIAKMQKCATLLNSGG
jgi:hypothetical protein